MKMSATDGWTPMGIEVATESSLPEALPPPGFVTHGEFFTSGPHVPDEAKRMESLGQADRIAVE
jgi:hypothetical protein